MDEFQLSILVITAALVASTLAAVAGFGGAVIMLPVLVLVFGVQEAIPILTISQLLGNLSRVLLNRKELYWPVVKRFSIGAIPTAIIGGIVFATAPAAALTRVLGLFLMLVVFYRHTSLGKQTKMKLGGFLPLGIASGFMSATMGVVGPVAAPFFLAFGLIKGAYIGTEAMTTVVMHVTKLGVYGSYALISLSTLLAGTAIGVVMFFGTYIGKRILNRVPEKVFPFIIEITLLISGVIFIIRG